MRDSQNPALAALIIALGTCAAPAVAQQASSDAQQQAPAAEQQSADAPQQDQGDQQVQVERADASPTVVFDFTLAELQGEDYVDEGLEMAQDPHVARLSVSADAASGSLVFEDLATFTEWRETEMGAFFEPLGGPDVVETSLRVTRADLLRATDPLAATDAMGSVSIEYSSSGNEATGDADVDAVTVICPGDDADCKPSN